MVFILSLSPCALYGREKSTIEKTGDIVQLLVPATAYVTTFTLSDKEGRGQFYKSFFVNTGLTYTLKYTIDRKRPENNGDHSFPSGHTAAAFQGATFIHRRYGLKYGIPAYIGAAYVGYSRVEGESDQHDFLDVGFGAAIGILTSYYFTRPYKWFTVSPLSGNGVYGFMISKKW